jgi:uncharacterized membrane protein
MPMEQETINVLAQFFGIIMTIIVITIIYLNNKNKHYKTAYNLIIAHLTFTMLSAIYIIKAMKFDANHPFASEEVTRLLYYSAGLWTISMIFFALGLIKLSKTKPPN